VTTLLRRAAVGSRPFRDDRVVFPGRYCGHSILLTTRYRSSERYPVNELHSGKSGDLDRH
jgi:hypothetical protein